MTLFKIKLNNILNNKLRNGFKLSNKFCEFDHMPAWRIRDYIEELLPLLTNIIKNVGPYDRPRLQLEYLDANQ